MVTIDIFHAPKRCPKCERAEEIARAVAAGVGSPVDIRLRPVSDAPAKLGVIMPPTVVVGDTTVVIGGIPRKTDIEQALLEQLGEAGEKSGAADAEGSAFGHRQAVFEGDIAYVCAETFDEESGCEPMLLFWYVDEGDVVGEGDELAEIESAKAVFVLESPAAGVLERTFVTEGQPVEPNQRLAAIRIASADAT